MNNLFQADSQRTNNGHWVITEEFGAPVVPDILKDDEGNEEPGGLLPRTALNADLEVLIPQWEFDQHRLNIVILSWRRAGAPFIQVSRFTFEPPIAPGDKQVAVLESMLEEGVYELSYKISLSGNDGRESLKKTVTVDLTPPDSGQQPRAVVFPPELAGVISEEYLAREGKVECAVQPYFELRAKDVAIWYWSNSNPPPDLEKVQGEVLFTQDDIDNDRLIIPVNAQVVRQAGQGIRYLYYRLRDLAGNLGPRSVLSSITVDLTPPPENLKPARVPLSIRDLIDRQHAREGATSEGGVTVEIDRYDNAEPGHFIIIDWDGTELAEVPVVPSGFPLRTYVPWGTLTARGLGPMTAEVDYQVRRGTLLTPALLPVSVPVDLTIAGQDHTNAPALLNVTLDKIEVRGQYSDIPNTLTGADFGLDATATVALFQDPHPGERLEVFWGRSVAAIAEYTVKASDVAGQPISFTIPWSAIEPELINPALPVYYLTDNGVNQQLSLETNVNVNIEVIEDLTEPSFPHADLYGYLNCGSEPKLWEGVTVRVPGDPRFTAGDRIELAWQGCKNLNGTAPIPGAFATFSRTLDAAEASNGFDHVVLPFDTLIAPMEDNGSATARYTLYKTSGTVGRSRTDVVKITRTYASGEVCGPDPVSSK
ncbi:MAG: hypothetical protein ACRER8_07945 [Pseudomonas sp.]|uniref:hypothetical protein n=1 Tax=Pseudomonas sp. TaxID=306 RepID=UPI003D6DE433